MKAPQPIPYQGSKRKLAPTILKFFPDNVERIIEPFAGSAAICVASALNKKTNSFLINDLNTPLINLLKEIIQNPESISNKYESLWRAQLGNEKSFFIQKRKEFNQTKSPDLFLYVLARCIKGAVRYNTNGEFNQSADNRRRGKTPENMKKEIFTLSSLLKDKTEFLSVDYTKVFSLANKNDIVYMDPPYQGTSGNKDQRYYSGLQFDEFVSQLEYLNNNSISYIISYDGKTGEKSYGNDLPKYLRLKKMMIEAGRSTQSTLLGRKDLTYESLYLSESLVDKIQPKNQKKIITPMQPELL